MPVRFFCCDNVNAKAPSGVVCPESTERTCRPPEIAWLLIRIGFITAHTIYGVKLIDKQRPGKGATVRPKIRRVLHSKPTTTLRHRFMSHMCSRVPECMTYNRRVCVAVCFCSSEVEKALKARFNVAKAYCHRTAKIDLRLGCPPKLQVSH